MGKTAEKLSQLADEIIKNNVCPELAETANQLVMGDGDPDADIVMIGEAPGKKEDETGRPFVGAAGKFLDEMLASIGMKRTDIYITNIVKYRPPENRDPKEEEKRAFLPYLERQLKLIKPKLIITLGRHSGAEFIPNLRISRDHGIPKRMKTVVYMPLYHPAAALYNGGMRQTLLDDFAKIPKTLQEINQGSK
ncbi:uracil-DNA glycosylase [Candidatus Saccharibacteria bacterium]|jgi:uracil-DNA glycosylase family 4|nr:uracil-DNA glycosylase [Candidatus Saccharibacteria bacterium]MBP9132185.1 uracil-DNA glycosylase [Candidatus Saccharibacteria bacterium]